MRVGPLSPEEFNRLHPKVRYGGKLYRVHKDVGTDGVRLITLDGESTIDVPKSEIAPRPRAKRCVACGRNFADAPSQSCPGCQAYAEHQR
jgi:hypothetical protein